MQRTPPPKVKHAPTYLKTAPSTTPQEAMDARQQAHINELTEQLRTAEYMSKKLREELAQAQAQMKAERATLRDQRVKEAQAWKVGTELMRVSHKVSQARLLLLLDSERRSVLSGEDSVIRERLARIQRDYKLVLFQQREDELEEKVIELQEMLEAEREERTKGDQEYEELREKYGGLLAKYGKVRDKLSTLLVKSAEMHRDLERSGTKRGQIEDDVSRLEEEVKNLKAESATLKSTLKRESLRFDNAKNEKDELENANTELKRSNADLKRQVDKWQNLENKEGAETEKLRKERIALEVKFREVETQHTEREQQLTEELELKDAKMEKFRVRLRDYVSSDKESRRYIEELEETCEELKRRVATFKEKNVQLRAELSTAQQEIKIHNTVEREHGSKPITISDVDIPFGDEEPSPTPSTRKPKPPRKSKTDVGEGPSRPPPSKKKAPPPEPEPEPELEEVEEVEEVTKPKSRPKPAKKPPSKNAGELVEGNSKRGRGKKTTEEDVEKPRPKPKPKKKASVQETIEDSEEEVQELEVEPSKAKGKGKAKSSAPQESASVVPRKRTRTKTATDEEEVQPAKKKSTTKKAAGRPTATSQRGDEEDEAEEEAKVKKKRKLKIFNSSQPPALTWAFGGGEGANGLDIPTELSPMKEGEPMVPRSIFSSRTSSSFMR